LEVRFSLPPLFVTSIFAFPIWLFFIGCGYQSVFFFFAASRREDSFEEFNRLSELLLPIKRNSIFSRLPRYSFSRFPPFISSDSSLFFIAIPLPRGNRSVHAVLVYAQIIPLSDLRFPSTFLIFPPPIKIIISSSRRFLFLPPFSAENAMVNPAPEPSPGNLKLQNGGTLFFSMAASEPPPVAPEELSMNRPPLRRNVISLFPL